ncbi:hypothetical protein ID866_4999 [Astraeus odoratus]|nr:hypothetical protein ID866_4999 [Astraeus odoratus]
MAFPLDCGQDSLPIEPILGTIGTKHHMHRSSRDFSQCTICKSI